MRSISAAYHVGAARHCGGDEVYVEGVELRSDQAELPRQVSEQLCMGSSSQLVYDLANSCVEADEHSGATSLDDLGCSASQLALPIKLSTICTSCAQSSALAGVPSS
jgi:hypothetical protein